MARVSPKGLAVVLRMRCRGSVDCVVRTRRRARVKIAGERFQALALAPKTIAAGESGAVRLRLPKSAAQVTLRASP